MPDTTNPAAPGPQTSEHGFAKVVQLVGLVVTTASGVLAGVAAVFEALHHSFPQVVWITAALGAITGVGAMVKSASDYMGGRSDVKTAMINLQAAQVVAQGPAPRNP